MARTVQLGIAALAVGAAAFCCGFAANQPKQPQRIGMVIGIKPEEYGRVHEVAQRRQLRRSRLARRSTT